MIIIILYQLMVMLFMVVHILVIHLLLNMTYIYIYNKYQYISSVYIINLPLRILPYSTGVKLIINVVPSLPYGSKSPIFGITENSASLSGENAAVNLL